MVSYFPAVIETYYSLRIYKYIADFQRIITGFMPFSIGDIFYASLVVIGIYWIIKFIKLLINNQLVKCHFILGSIKFLKIFLWLYIVFNGLWGLNYNRLGIGSQLNLKQIDYTTEELKAMTCDIVEKLNNSRLALGDSNYQYPKHTSTYYQALTAYQQANKSFSFLDYQHYSVKSSLLSLVVSYAGYSGYYNPFTGEAQLNNDLPEFLLPFVTCHEMAHQLGYASESEANFVGYLAAIHSNNQLFIYSGYFDVFMSANAELLSKDFFAGYLNLLQLNSLVKRDRRIYKTYVMGKKNNMQPILSNLYDQYLKANQQKSGI
ncbi:MAG: DUF3810 domain-containing protein, partial [Deinococcales bacterium]|nr:DUF3810 domain-containing protein [Chitinophagaceae bacterium]